MRQGLTTWWQRLPRLRTSIRVKITLPYVLLAAIIALAGAYVITRLVVDSVQERFVNQLMEAGRLVSDRVVAIEEENLALLRVLAHTEGFAEALEAKDRAELERLAYPVAVNQGGELVEFVDPSGVTIRSLHHHLGGGPADYTWSESPISWAAYPFVARVLREDLDDQGDKFAGLVEAPWGRCFYIAGPVYREDVLVGVILVGRYLETLPGDLRQASAAQHVTLYNADGDPLVSSFPLEEIDNLPLTPEQAAQVLDEQDMLVFPRDISFRGRIYSEVLGSLEIRGGVDLGLFSVALIQSSLVRASPITQVQLVLLIAATFLAVVVLGTLVAQRLSRPILEVVRASQKVAGGDLNQQVTVRTRDEVGDLAESFNEMIRELKRGQQIRELFGRAVSPEISRALIDAVQKGEISLTGENRVVTTLFTDIRGFTSLAEGRSPQEVVALLNQVLGTFIDVIDVYGGVVNKFGGDSLLAIFGAPMQQPDHARRAVDTGLDMVQRLSVLNEGRRADGLKPIEAGIGLNTGEVVAGPMGSAKRLEYTVIGDTVNITARVQGLARQYEGRSLFITEETLQALGSDHGLDLEDLGLIPLRGKSEPVRVYAVRGRLQPGPASPLAEVER